MSSDNWHRGSMPVECSTHVFAMVGHAAVLGAYDIGQDGR